MASGPSVAAAIEILDQELGSDRDVRLWTVAPSRTGSGGTQVTGGGYIPAVLTAAPAVAGTGGQIAKASNQVAFLFANMPVPSSAVVAISVHVHSTGAMRWLNDSWSSPVGWAAGESPMLSAGSFAIAFVPVP